MIPQWAPVAVLWLDAHSDYDDAKSSEYAQRWKKQLRRTIGWLIHDDRERIVLAMDDDRQCNGENDCQTVTTIPRGMVQSVTVFREVPKRKPKK